MTDRLARTDPFDYSGSSFSDLIRRISPLDWPGEPAGHLPHVEGTTIVAAVYEGGVVIAGDRRATAGNLISKRDMRKIFQTDRVSAVGISGSAGPAIELAKVFATELEHYEKVEGSELSLEGKANKLASMVRGNLPMAMQGLVIVPLFAGYDRRSEVGRIFDFDVAGGRYEERRFSATGSGGLHARASLKARWERGMGADEAVDLTISALWDAADEDSATGGPDTVRGLYPIVAQIDADGYAEREEDEVAERARQVADARGDRLSAGSAIADRNPRPDAPA
ncbi:proteasome subunit beta [Euzebya tangerina]|uniref:proteasome subunit beta n=1 Tax=Euzebya tangerina TaxID=591198 RepID=UPI000E31CDA5|nr:proteasome subunit beta [Euzebya tangerina]